MSEHQDSRPSWTDYFLGLAFMARSRSRDEHTQHGCVITDRGHRILGVGYNSFPAGINDASLPINRPINPNDPEEESKYDWMVHSELNALANCSMPLWLVPNGAIAYITGQPCHNCAMWLSQFGVKKFVIANRKGWEKENAKTERQFNKLVTERGIEVERVSPNLSWILKSLEVPIKLGFVKQFLKWLSKFGLSLKVQVPADPLTIDDIQAEDREREKRIREHNNIYPWS